MDPNATVSLKKDISPESFSPGHYNRIIPPEIYKSDLSYVELSRDILNCNLCPNTNCKSKKVEIDSEKKSIYFVIDDFFIPTLKDWRVQFIHNQMRMKYPNQSLEDDIHITPSYKTEGGNAYSCSDFLRSEILLNEPKVVYYFSKYLPSITSRITNYGEYEMLGNTRVISLPPLESFINDNSISLQQYL